MPSVFFFSGCQLKLQEAFSYKFTLETVKNHKHTFVLAFNICVNKKKCYISENSKSLKLMYTYKVIRESVC